MVISNFMSPQYVQNELIDNHGRVIDYLRLAITDRCNLRCRYCMPDDGVEFVPHNEILKYEELLRLAEIFSGLGIRKIRVTGGEPFSRRDSISFLQELKKIKGVDDLYVTTNGVVTWQYLDKLKEIGIGGINLSLDTVNRDQFKELAGSDQFHRVMQTLHGCLERNIPLKINSVVLDETSDDTILSLANLAREHPVMVRFIEKMPFSGTNGSTSSTQGLLCERVASLFELQEVENDKPATSRIFAVPGFKGTIGIIEGHSRKFCSSCNKLRITPLGMLKTCLYDSGAMDLKVLLRSGIHQNEISRKIIKAVQNRYVNGKVAEASCRQVDQPSMASIGG